MPDNAWGDQLGDDEIYINSWGDFLQTKFAKENVPDWHNKIDCIENCNPGQNIDDTCNYFKSIRTI